MPSFRTAFKSKFLKADDLGTSKPIVEIESVDFEDIGQGDKQESKLVVHFVGKDRGLVLNMVNAETIAEIAGDDDYGEWPGVSIRLFATKTEFGGKRVPCIRIDAPPKGTARKRSEPERLPDPETSDTADFVNDDSIPF